jgi:hypothetical protein
MIVDIAFALDCTGSMQGWIDAAKRQIRDLVRDLSTQYQDSTFRVATVLYRDFGDEFADFSQHDTLNFTTNLDEFQHFLDNVRAAGGDDEAEDVAGAFHLVNQLSWNGDVRTLFHITDAPAHGLRYHEPYTGDRYPDQDPQNYNLEAEVQSLAEKRITMMVIKANNSVNKMLSEFADIYARIPGSSFRVQNLEGQTTPPRMRRDHTFLEPPALVRPLRPLDTPEMRTLSRMVTDTIIDSISSQTSG